jgi:hypothetical protein
MISRLASRGGKALAYHVAGRVTQEEVRDVHREIEEAIRREGKARILVEIGDLGMPEPMAVLEDFKLVPEYVRDVERFALVGDQRWQPWATRLTGLLTRGEARHFASDEVDLALDWLEAA